MRHSVTYLQLQTVIKIVTLLGLDPTIFNLHNPSPKWQSIVEFKPKYRINKMRYAGLKFQKKESRLYKFCQELVLLNERCAATYKQYYSLYIRLRNIYMSFHFYHAQVN